MSAVKFTANFDVNLTVDINAHLTNVNDLHMKLTVNFDSQAITAIIVIAGLHKLSMS